MALGINSNIMSASIQSVLTYESGASLEYEDFPPTEEPVFILGKCYSALYDREELKHDILSKLWFTYRKGFSPIGGMGPTSDAGWGCMLRCGQMMLAQALVSRHLGREWRWNPDQLQTKYSEILNLFLDRKGSYYSIHQIASMGVSEGKSVGQWFGPNTVAQVLKKLSVYDVWSSLSIHIALDNTVIIDDIKLMCKSHPSTPDDLIISHTVDHKARTITGSPRRVVKNGSNSPRLSSWRPLLLIIPLRLGLSEMNAVYVESVKQAFTVPQSVGIIGGKPNHAHWFIGYVGEELVYLDPHTTQQVANVSRDRNEKSNMDESYHCQYSSRMKITDLDPSIALGFYCGTEDEFDSLCQELMLNVVHPKKTPMFEIHQTRPCHWPPFEPYPDQSGTKSGFTLVDDRQYDTDEEFELV